MLHFIVKKVKKRLHSGQRNAPAQPTPANPEETAEQEETSAETAPPANRPQGGRKKKPSSRPRRKPKKPASAPETSPWDPTLFQVPAAKGKTRFQDLDLPDEILHAIYDLGFEYCTPIQAEILPPVLVGKDAFGKAQTGTGKSAAFLIAIFTRLMRHSVPQGTKNGQPRALILAPTRELVVQITRDAEDLGKYSPVNTLAVFGGIDYEKQKQALKQERIDVLIATPGRLLDYARRKVVRLDQVEILVIDEADRLLDMGFIPDVRQIINQTPYKDKRQTMLFSATLTPQIGHLAAQWTREPITVEIEPEQVAAESVEQIVYLATSEEKFTVLYNLITQKDLDRVIVFCNRKDVTRKVRDKLYQHGISCALLSGDVPQNKRMRTLDNFKNGKI
ncbi:MAG: DEAD/DEAH box helicase, partial [Deltaproteobacteria bacterium]